MTIAEKTEQQYIEEIHQLSERMGGARIMEVCGTHTVSLFRTGVKSLLPQSLKLISGPGCPVCVTAQGYLDAACKIADQPNVTICTYGDMLRVPGRDGSLERRKAAGASIRVVYSAEDALRYAESHPDQEVVFLAVGFETTAPASASVVKQAYDRRVDNFSILPGHKLVMPAMRALLADGDAPLDGFLLPGHVSVILGVQVYEEIVTQHQKACVVTGFEYGQLLRGITQVLKQLDNDQRALENVYGVAVNEHGNPAALAMMWEVFEPEEAMWRAMGGIPESGLGLKEKYRQYDARIRYEVNTTADYHLKGCRCGEVIQGRIEPTDCKLFERACTPSNPIGPCMVSSEGTCAAWYKYGRHTAER